MLDDIQKYRASEQQVLEKPLVQGEILSNVIQIQVQIEDLQSENPDLRRIEHVFAIVVSQSCDLERDHYYRFTEPENSTESRLLPNILFCEMGFAADLESNYPRSKGNKLSRDWTIIQQNKNERYHFFERIQPHQDAINDGIEELVVDFKRYFTIPADELYRRIALDETQRRCSLTDIYATHFSTRFAFFQLRVALPGVHLSE